MLFSLKCATRLIRFFFLHIPIQENPNLTFKLQKIGLTPEKSFFIIIYFLFYWGKKAYKFRFYPVFLEPTCGSFGSYFSFLNK